MTVIPLGPGLPQGSSHLPADLSEPLIARQACACSIRLFGVAPGGGYRVSPAAIASGDSSLWPCSSSSPKASLRLLRTAVSRHPALWSPDFPLRTLRYAATAWPASQLDFNRASIKGGAPGCGGRDRGYFFRPLRGASLSPRRGGVSCGSSACLRPGRKCWVSS